MVEEENMEDLPTIDQLSNFFFLWLEHLFEERDIEYASLTRGYDSETLTPNNSVGIVFKSEADLPDAEANAFIVWEDNFPNKFGYFLDYAEDELESMLVTDDIKEILKEKGYNIAKRKGW